MTRRAMPKGRNTKDDIINFSVELTYKFLIDKIHLVMHMIYYLSG